MGVRENNDAFYTCLNNINDGKFRYFMADGHKSGHDNFNYVVTTWEHRFNKKIHTKTEAYYMWQFDAVVGGTPSLGAAAVVRWRRRSWEVHPGQRPRPTASSITPCSSSRRETTSRSATSGGTTRRGERSGFATHLLQSHHRDQPSV